MYDFRADSFSLTLPIVSVNAACGPSSPCPQPSCRLPGLSVQAVKAKLLRVVQPGLQATLAQRRTGENGEECVARLLENGGL